MAVSGANQYSVRLTCVGQHRHAANAYGLQGAARGGRRRGTCRRRRTAEHRQRRHGHDGDRRADDPSAARHARPEAGQRAAIAPAASRRHSGQAGQRREGRHLDHPGHDPRRGAGGRALAVGADVSDAADVDRAVSRVADKLGAPTVLINNAGVTRDNLLFKMTEADWDSVIGVHLKGSFLMSKAVQKYMVDAGWGRIVNLSSTSALGNRGQSNYSAAKAGLQGFTKTLAIELGKFGITANCIAPGFIISDMTKAAAERIGEDWDTYVVARAAQIPVARAGVVDDIAHAVSFFVSDGAGFVSGQVICVAGGPKA